jgi:hypothetical protein
MQHTIEFTDSPVPDAVVVLSGPISVEGMAVWLHALVGSPRRCSGRPTSSPRATKRSAGR